MAEAKNHKKTQRRFRKMAEYLDGDEDNDHEDGDENNGQEVGEAEQDKEYETP